MRAIYVAQLERVAHPGGRKVIDNVQKALGLTDAQLRFSRAALGALQVRESSIHYEQFA